MIFGSRHLWDLATLTGNKFCQISWISATEYHCYGIRSKAMAFSLKSRFKCPPYQQMGGSIVGGLGCIFWGAIEEQFLCTQKVITFCVHKKCSSIAPPKIHPKPPTILLLTPYLFRFLINKFLVVWDVYSFAKTGVSYWVGWLGTGVRCGSCWSTPPSA